MKRIVLIDEVFAVYSNLALVNKNSLLEISRTLCRNPPLFCHVDKL